MQFGYESLIEKAAKIVAENLSRGQHTPLSQNLSDSIRIKYFNEIPLFLKTCGDDKPIFNRCGTEISSGYDKIVIGDYGAYVEIPEGLINKDKIEHKFCGQKKSDIFYEWMFTKDKCATKVYYQLRRVKYADYCPGKYYVSVHDVKVRG